MDKHREAVIRALEICAVGGSCQKCPMCGDCFGGTNAAMAAAIELLKEDDHELDSLGKSLTQSADLVRKLQGILRQNKAEEDDGK